jgi:anti-sigma B factor antagonist
MRWTNRGVEHEMPSDFTIEEHPIDSERHVVAVRGDLDLFTASGLKEVLAEAIEAGRIRIIVDLAETTFLDSTALGVLMAALKRLRSHSGALAIVNLNENLTTIFKITALDQTFTILPTLDAAIEAVASADAA